MPFITQGKTNWKFLLIVIILAVIVGGGAYWQYISIPTENPEVGIPEKEKSTIIGTLVKLGHPFSGWAILSEGEYYYTIGEESSEVINYEENSEFEIIGYISEKETTIPQAGDFVTVKIKVIEISSYRFLEDETADWKTYRNEEYGFEIKYPNQLSMKETYISEKPPTGIFLVSEDKNYFRGIIWARIFAKDEQKPEEKCISKAQELLSYKDREVINAIPFYHFVNYPEQIGAYCGMSSGCNYKDLYRAFYNDYCYQIEYSRYDREFIEGDPYDPPHKVIEDVKEIPTLFDQILSTFRFIEDFCGTSTFGSCDNNSDCVKDGCSSQVCRSKDEEGVVTTCEYKDCYNAQSYGLECKCVDKKCQWAK